VRALVEAICRNCERLKLWGEIGREPVYLVELTAFGTTLAMNFLHRGNFTGDKKSKGQKADGKKSAPVARSPKPEDF
jgi:hypothetical protein